MPLDKTMQVADTPQRIDLHIEKQFQRKNVESHRLAQIGLRRRLLEHRGARLQEAETISPDPGKHGLSVLDEPIRIDRSERGDRRNPVAHDISVRAA